MAKPPKKKMTAEQRRKKHELMKTRRQNKYQQQAKENLEGVTRVIRQQQAKKLSGKDAGDSESTREIDKIAKQDSSFWQRIKKMVKSW